MNESRCPSDYQLDAFWLEGKPDGHPVGKHLAGCAECQARWEEIEDAQKVFQQEVFPQSEQAVVDRSTDLLGGFKGAFSRMLSVPRLAAVSALAVLIVLAVTFWPGQDPDDDGSYIGIKGSIGLQVFCQRGDHVFLVNPGDLLLAEDKIRFQVTPSGPGHLLVISVDGNGQVHRYASSQVAGGEQALPGSIVLDDSPGDERIFVLFSPENIDFARVQEAVAEGLRSGARPEKMDSLPLELDQASLWFRKGRIR
jgi:hypothetical protein